MPSRASIDSIECISTRLRTTPDTRPKNCTPGWKATLIPKKFATVLGKDVELKPTTTTLSKAEFGELLDRFAAERGEPLPDPQAAGYISNY